MIGQSVSIDLVGQRFTLRPTYRAMEAIEEQTQVTCAELLELVVRERMRIREAVLIIWHGAQAAGEKFDDADNLGALVFREKMTSQQMRRSIAEYLLACLYAPEDARKKLLAEIDPLLGIPPIESADPGAAG